MKRLLLVTALAVVNVLAALAQFDQNPAFPGADGFGRYTTGGREDDGNFAIYHVTNLEDSGQGSFRFGAATAGSKIIVFDVSGTIHLKSDLKIQGNKTILGQTAPGDGICLADYPVTVGGNNVIIRYIRFRMGDVGSQAKAAADPKYEGDDALGGKGCSNIIIDHCSVSWSTDECCSFYGNTDFTMQYCIISESLKASVHAKGSHGYGGIWGGKNASFHHNLIIHHDSRNPRFDHDYVSTLKGPIDYVNNVVYNWGGNSTYGGESGNGFPKYLNMLNNYYKPGPASSVRTRLLNPTTACGNCTDETKFKATVGYVTPGKFYIAGNYMYGSSEVTSNNLCDAAIDPDKGTSFEAWKASSATSERAVSSSYDFDQYNVISMHSAEKAFEKVLKYAGASYRRDNIDKRLRWEALKGIAYFSGSNGSKNGMIDSQNDVGGLPELQDTGKPADTDNDGIPDAWETAHGLNPNNAADAKSYSICENDANNTSQVMYTNLEVYANSIVQDITQYERQDATETFTEYYPLGLKVLEPEADFPTKPDFVLPDIPDSGNDIFNSSKATDKNTAITGTSCTLNGEVNPSGTSGNYLKLRTGSGDWVFTVNEGYKMTAINIVAYQNNTSDVATDGAIKISGITVNGGSNLLSEAVSLPLNGSNKTANITLDNLSATQSINVSFDNSGLPASGAQKQCYAIVTISYEKIETGIEVVNAATNVKAETPAYYYNLQGQRVAPGTKGIVIYKGMKFFNP
ncbi:MAG: hypothetical protein J6N43_02770 [Prevotella sp.]|nr:hypothetical protein [Prevotella sp.]